MHLARCYDSQQSSGQAQETICRIWNQHERTRCRTSAGRYRLENPQRAATECPYAVRRTRPHRGTLHSCGNRACSQDGRSGIIVGYRAQIDPAKVGLPILAFVNVKVGGENLGRFMEVAGTHPEVLECHRVTGAESFLLKVAVCDVAHLEALLDALMPYVATTTLMVLSTALAWGNIVKPGTKPQPEAVRSRA